MKNTNEYKRVLLCILCIFLCASFIISSLNIAVEASGKKPFNSINMSNVRKYVRNNYKELYCVIPSNAVVGKSVRITVQQWDWAERITKTAFNNHIIFDSTDEKAILPEEFSFKKLDGGVKTIEDTLVFNTPGIHYVTVYDSINDIWVASNPVQVTEEESEYKWYWGDIHFHSTNSDGTGTPAHNTRYARDVSMLDFCALTDHDICWGFKRQLYLIKTVGWKRAKNTAEKFYEPGRFVPLLAYEYTNEIDGHYNVYYNTIDDAMLFACEGEQSKRVVDLWKNLKNWKNKTGYDVFTIPHHPIWTWDISYYDEEMVPLIEIFQYRGSSEMRNDQGNPVPFRTQYPEDSIGSVQNGLAKGFKIGFMASSDDHTGHPGHKPYLRGYFTEPLSYIGPVRFIPAGVFEKQHASWYLGLYSKVFYYRWLLNPDTVIETDYPNGGLTGVYAKDLTRDEIFNALKDRRCIAVTNQNRALIDFTINGVSVGNGSECIVENKDSIRTISCSIAGTAPLKNVTIVKNNKVFYYENGKGTHVRDTSNYKTNFTIIDDEPITGMQWDEDNGTDGKDVYYLRVIQTNNWATWYGPIWVSAKDTDTTKQGDLATNQQKFHLMLFIGSDIFLYIVIGIALAIFIILRILHRYQVF